ncbi:MAG: 5'-nucleotidase C-terminal domain-containing protein [Acidobacteriota bacterium]
MRQTNDASFSGAARLGMLGTFLLFLSPQACLAPVVANGKDVYVAAGHAPVAYWLTVIHSNDMESHLVNAGEGLEQFGGIDRFVGCVRRIEKEAESAVRGRHGLIKVSSGDNFLASAQFNQSLTHGVPYYDAVGQSYVEYDAVAFGNHEFDLGPDVLADYIRSFAHLRSNPPWLGANLDFSGERELELWVKRGTICRSVVVTKGGEEIGIIGATTPQLPYISSPRRVRVNVDVTGAVQRQINLMRSRGVNKIVLISHLQNILNEIALAPTLDGIDIIVAGGGHELLANPGDLLIPGDEAHVFGGYPVQAKDAAGRPVLIVTARQYYWYVGRLIAGFDANGEIVRYDQRSGPVRVAGPGNPDSVKPDQRVRREVVDPVNDGLAQLDATVVAVSDVALDGLRESIRARETNEGDLVVDSLLQAARRLAPRYGAPNPDVALVNGGAMRNATVIPAGDITELDTWNILPFPGFVCVVDRVPAAQFKEILENSVSQVELLAGRFAQIAGFKMVYDAAGTAQVLDADNNVVVAGTRIQQATLDDGRVLVSGGQVVAGAPDVVVAATTYMVQGGDQYPFRTLPYVNLGEANQQSLDTYLTVNLSGRVSGAQYPLGGVGRIVRLN